MKIGLMRQVRKAGIKGLDKLRVLIKPTLQAVMAPDLGREPSNFWEPGNWEPTIFWEPGTDQLLGTEQSLGTDKFLGTKEPGTDQFLGTRGTGSQLPVL